MCDTGRLLGPWSALNRLTTKHVQPYSPVGIHKLLAEVIFAAKKQYDLLSGRLSNKCWNVLSILYLLHSRTLEAAEEIDSFPCFRAHSFLLKLGSKKDSECQHDFRHPNNFADFSTNTSQKSFGSNVRSHHSCTLGFVRICLNQNSRFDHVSCTPMIFFFNVGKPTWQTSAIFAQTLIRSLLAL